MRGEFSKEKWGCNERLSFQCTCSCELVIFVIDTHIMAASNNTTNLHFKSKKLPLIILAVTAIICSRLLFFFFNDPEGPNLLIVTGLAATVYFLSFVIYVFSPLKTKGVQGLLAAIGVQILL